MSVYILNSIDKRVLHSAVQLKQVECLLHIEPASLFILITSKIVKF